MTPGSETLPLAKISRDVYERLDSSFDRLYGGFGGAPKFPSPSRTMHFLARYAIFNQANPEEAERAKHMAVNTMVNIYNGGIRDVVGGGFARYSVDERWHVPHCEYHLTRSVISLPTSCSQLRRCCTLSVTSFGAISYAETKL